MIHSIQIDIVEIIVVKSFDYKLFQELQKILIKLKEPSRISRINDKLTVVAHSFDAFHYRINKIVYHREYDKPDFISNKRHTWCLYNFETRSNKPSCCWIYGSRRWLANDIEFRNNDYPCYIDHDGEQKWSDKNRKPYSITHDGHRNDEVYIFRYL